MTASSDAAMADATDLKPSASGRRVPPIALSSLVLVLVLQRHVPEPLVGVEWLQPTLSLAVWVLSPVLAGQLVRCAVLKVRLAIRTLSDLRKSVKNFVRRIRRGVKIIIEPDDAKDDARTGGR